ncbi:O-antigen ligase family protein [Candidatus Azambacteria bacterium]|nr:O-antigen ligase family protein [Candidatus Azambacteria bacterium]
MAQNYLEKIIYFVLFFIPFSFALNLQADVDISFLRVVISFSFAFFVFYILYKNIPIPFDKFKNGQTLFFLAFFLFTLISSFWSLNSVWSIRKFIFFATIFPIYFLIIFLINSKEKLDKAAKFFILGGFFASLIGVVQFLSQFFFSLDSIYNFWAYKVAMFLYGQNFGSVVIQNQSWFVSIGRHDYLRAISLFPDPHTFALYLGIIIPFTVGYFFYKNKKDKSSYLFKIFIMLLALLFTFSRGAYVGFLSSFAVMFVLYFWYFNVGFNKKFLTALFVAALALFFVFSNSVFGERLISSFSLADISNSGRIQIWKTSFDVFLDSPVFGAGLGSLPVFFDPTASVKSPINAHNTYLDILSELGAIGFLFFAGIFAYSFKFLKFQKDKFNFLRLGIIWSLAWFLVHSFFETSIFSVPVLISLCFVLALAVILKDETSGQALKK